MGHKVVLTILDGWGLGDGSNADAIAQANTPYVDGLFSTYPHTTLKTSGTDVGLPEGQMGNSEVGHLNIGAGRVVYQDFERINKAIREGSIDSHPVLVNAFNLAKSTGKKLHFIGLVSDGGVHSHENHLIHLCQMASNAGIQHYFVHAFTDGRDTDPKSGLGSLRKLSDALAQAGTGKIASVIGRYYAMDRDKRWERIQLAYDLLVNGKGTPTGDVLKALSDAYEQGVTDEFIKPIVCTGVDGRPVANIEAGDVVVCFNFRTDRCREITMALTQQDFPDFNMQPLPLHYVTLTEYDASFKHVAVVYTKDNLQNTLGEILSQAGKTQLRIAETEKYPHVTFFFSGGRETPFEGESRFMAASPKVATYDLQPEMSAQVVTDKVVEVLKAGTTDFICLNFANIDMVGHTGIFAAATKAIETVDHCLGQVVEAGLNNGYAFVIIADHGNADCMVNPDGSPNTAHTTNPVPCIVIDKNVTQLHAGRLADIAPTVLSLMGIAQPSEMDGKSLY